MAALAVILGVALVSGVLVFRDTVGRAFERNSAKSLSNITVTVGALPGVDSATDVLSGSAVLIDPKRLGFGLVDCV